MVDTISHRTKSLSLDNDPVFNPNKDPFLKQMRYKETDKIRHTDSLNVVPTPVAKPNAELLFSKDVIETCAAAQAPAVLQQQAQTQPDAMVGDSSEGISGTPTLKTPKQVQHEKATRISKELNEGIARNHVNNTQRSEQEGHGNDGIRQALVEVVKELLRLKDQQLLTGKDMVMFEQQKLQELEKKFRLLTREIIKAEKDLDVAEKIKLAADITLGVMSAAAVVLAILSFFSLGIGAAIEAVVGTTAAVAGITSGSAQIFITETEYKLQGFRAEHLDLKEKRELSNEMVASTFKAENHLNDHVLRTMKEVFIIEKSRNDTKKSLAAAAA